MDGMSPSDARPRCSSSRCKGSWHLTRQRRGACSVHRPENARSRGRTFSVHLDKNVFACFDPACSHKGDVIDLWAALKGLSPPPSTWSAPSLSNPRPPPRQQRRGTVKERLT